MTDPVRLPCPHCQQLVIVRVGMDVALARDPIEPRLPLISTVRTEVRSTPPLDSAPAARDVSRGTPQAAAAKLWRRGMAIAHRVIEEYPQDGASQSDAFKAYCTEQGIDYAAPAGPERRPLYVRALEAAHVQRQRRGA